MIRFAAPADWWGEPLMRRFGDLETWFLQIVPLPDGGCTQFVRLQGAQAANAVEWLVVADPCALVLVRQAGCAVVRVTSFDCPLARLSARSRAVPHLPFVARGGEVSWLVLEQPDTTRALLDCLGQAGLRPRIVRSGEWSSAADELTRHQRGVLETALASGFYDAPRRITVTALARRIGISKSTLSEALIAIESKIMQARLRHPPPPIMRPVRTRQT